MRLYLPSTVKGLLVVIITLIITGNNVSVAASSTNRAAFIANRTNFNKLEPANNNKTNFELASLQPYTPSIPKNSFTYPFLFGSKETESANLSAFPKWTGVLARYYAEQQMPEPCPISTASNCPIAAWKQFLHVQQGKEVMEQIEAVNTYVNQAHYVNDLKNWHVNDYWETPYQFFERNSGDCEDFAITKFISLRLLGIPNSALRIVVLNDTNMRAIHAVLVVYVNGQAYILDNQIKHVVRASSIHHYQPIYSINENNWWRHRV